MLTIDGSQGEGGGQVLRTSLSMAAVLGRDLRMHSIRAGRSTPGLAAQHLTSIRAAAAVCGAEVHGARIGSQEIVFRPGAVRGGRQRFDVGTAGAATLVLQTVIPPLLLAPKGSLVQIHGGTNVNWSPAQEYLKHVFLPAIEEMGAQVELACLNTGFYPRGVGCIEARIAPLSRPLGGLSWRERGELRSLRAVSVASGSLPEHILGRQIEGARAALGSAGLAVERSRPQTLSPGTMLMIAAGFERGRAGFTANGERGKPAETVGREAGEEAAAFLEGAASVDEHLADQLLIYAAMAREETSFRTAKITDHLRTNACTIREFLQVDIQIDEKSGIVSIYGVGVRPRRRPDNMMR